MAIAINNDRIINYEQLLGNRLPGTAFTWALGGTDLTNAGTATVDAAPNGGTTATATPILQNGAITGVNITNPGAGYTGNSVPVTFSATGVTGVGVIKGGQLTSVTITNSGGRTFTGTDVTPAYPTGDSRAAVNFVLHDTSGHKYEFSITAGNSVTVSLGTKQLFIGDNGLKAEVTVTTTLNKKKDGSAHRIGTLNSSGSFVMEK